MRLRVWMSGGLKEMEPENHDFIGLEGMTVDELLHTLDVAAVTSVVTVDEIIVDRQFVLQKDNRVKITGLIGGG
jgi:sulfur carrier protein ThiS